MYIHFWNKREQEVLKKLGRTIYKNKQEVKFTDSIHYLISLLKKNAHLKDRSQILLFLIIRGLQMFKTLIWLIV